MITKRVGWLVRGGSLVVVWLVWMNAAFRSRRTRPCAKDLPRPAGDHRAAEPRRADLLRPREEAVRQLHGRPPRRRTPRALVRRAAGDAARPGAPEPRADVRAARRRLAELE